MAECKYYKQVRQVSYDNGVTWISLDEYQKGDLYENDSPDCGGGITQYKWVNVSGEYTCVGTTKYQKTKKQQSTDGGRTWTDVNPPEYSTGAVIAYNSQDCIGADTKLSLTYSNGQSYSKECDNNSTLTSGETRPNGYVYTGITSAAIGDCVTTIADGNFENSAFYDCKSLTSVTIGSGVTYIGYTTFDFSKSLTSVMFPNGSSVRTINHMAFFACYSLTKFNSNTNGLLNIPSGVTYIGSQAFAECTGFTSINIPNSVSTIGNSAFDETSIRNITIPNSVTSIGWNPFDLCTSLTSITVDSTNNYYSSLDGVLFNKSKTLLISFPYGKSSSYTIPNGVTVIGVGAFGNCKKLTSVSIPNTVTTLSASCFGGCWELESITIPSSVTFIGGGVFQQCYYLTSLTCLATTPPTMEYENCLHNTPIENGRGYIYVPSSSVNAYKSAYGWSQYSSRIRAIS